MTSLKSRKTFVKIKNFDEIKEARLKIKDVEKINVKKFT